LLIPPVDIKLVVLLTNQKDYEHVKQNNVRIAFKQVTLLYAAGLDTVVLLKTEAAVGCVLVF